MAAKLAGMSAAQKAAALKLLQNIMDSWLQGSVRGYVNNWK